MDHVDCVVAGAGVVGLTAARALALSGRDVLVLEATRHFGSETSSRNSEVIHAGLYYEPGSSKALHCLEGKRRLYRYVTERNIPHRCCGKLIVATQPSQLAKLEAIEARAKACGVNDLELIDGAAARRHEPALTAKVALLSPSTGIIDSHAFMASLLADIENAGSSVVFGTRVEGGRRTVGGLALSIHSDGEQEPFELSTSLLVNACGLQAQRLAAAIEGFPSEHVPPLHLAKGNYFSISGRSPFARLIYPVPVEGGLGVHLTFDLSGQMRFGPDVEWVDRIEYSVDATRSASFSAEIRRFWPGLPDDALVPAYSGIRPKLAGPGQASSDFAIEGSGTHGFPSIVNLFGIESPGLTASLALAEAVVHAAG